MTVDCDGNLVTIDIALQCQALTPGSEKLSSQTLCKIVKIISNCTVNSFLYRWFNRLHPSRINPVCVVKLHVVTSQEILFSFMLKGAYMMAVVAIWIGMEWRDYFNVQ